MTHKKRLVYQLLEGGKQPVIPAGLCAYRQHLTEVTPMSLAEAIAEAAKTFSDIGRTPGPILVRFCADYRSWFVDVYEDSPIPSLGHR